ncbi:hypothetical protein M2284_002649 [Rhodococcus sp. LBL1]|nr:hypothetical protein [Rhodococcus sp. LBL1]MDH6684033.1 hypothetical protein [Rhodococcus sp. LBL2]
MANTFLTPDVIAANAMATLYENLCMVPLVYTDVSSDFTKAKVGDTVNIRKPATFEAKTFDRVAGIELQDATEENIPVKLDKIADVSFAVTSEDMTLHLEDFDAQLLQPACEALAQKIDRELLKLRSDITQVVGESTQSGFEWDKPEALIEAGRLLNIAKVPTSQRHAVVGPTTHAKWLNSPLLKQADQSGETAALRQGSIGRNLFGFDAYMTQNIEQSAGTPAVGQPTTEVGIAFHQNAFALASAPLALPTDSTWAAVQNYKGISIRVAKQYDITHKKEIVSLDVLYGVKTIDKNRAAIIRGDLKK